MTSPAAARAHLDVDGERAAGAHQDAFALVDREPGQLSGDRVRAGRQIVQAVEAGRVRDVHHRRQQRRAGRGHAYAGQ